MENVGFRIYFGDNVLLIILDLRGEGKEGMKDDS